MSCNGPGLLKPLDPIESSHETLVMDSVYAFVHALEDMRQETCPGFTDGLAQK